MTVDSRLIITCNKEDVLNIGKSVSEALSEYSRGKLDNYWKNNTDAINRMNFMFNKKYK